MSANTYLPISPVKPRSLLISNMTRAQKMVVTVTTSNPYVVGQLVHLTVPAAYGMIQADQKNAEILAINGLDFTLSIDSTQFDPFVIPTWSVTQPVAEPASLSPAGSRNLYNISNVPFQSLNGSIGN